MIHSRIVIIIVVFLFPLSAMGADVTFREPFTLKLHVDKEHYYEEKFDKIPYVNVGVVYLFKGDSFGVKLKLVGDTITEVVYVPAGQHADITFEFSQERMSDSPAIMLLKINNHTKNKIFMDALMTVPGKKRIFKTTILPLEAGLPSYESWPHAIVQLALKDFRTQPRQH